MYKNASNIPSQTQHIIKKSDGRVNDLSALEFQFLCKGKCNVFKGTNRIRRKNALLRVADDVPYPKRRVEWAY